MTASVKSLTDGRVRLGHHGIEPTAPKETAMSKSQDAYAALLRSSTNLTRSNSGSADDGFGSFTLRDTLQATEVQEMSFTEFRAAMEKTGRAFA
jgi:hypothetical protein